MGTSRESDTNILVHRDRIYLNSADYVNISLFDKEAACCIDYGYETDNTTTTKFISEKRRRKRGGEAENTPKMPRNVSRFSQLLPL